MRENLKKILYLKIMQHLMFSFTLDSQIVLGVLSSLFLLNTLVRTIKWKRRFGSQIIDGEVRTSKASQSET